MVKRLKFFSLICLTNDNCSFLHSSVIQIAYWMSHRTLTVSTKRVLFYYYYFFLNYRSHTDNLLEFSAGSSRRGAFVACSSGQGQENAHSNWITVPPRSVRGLLYTRTRLLYRFAAEVLMDRRPRPPPIQTNAPPRSINCGFLIEIREKLKVG